jgi:hypothetical protein
MQTLNLNTLDRERHAVEKDGVKYVVHPMTPRILTTIEAADAVSDMDRVRGLADAVAAILPDMPRAMVDDFSLAQLYAVIRLASTQVTAVEGYLADPNVPRSAVEATPLAERTGKGKKRAESESAGATSSAD